MTNSNYIQSTSICVITPVYNREDCIGKCIDSVITQDYENLEYWIVDDGSSDHTSEIISRYAQQYPFIKYHHFERNRGVNAARNYGITHCSNNFILFLDSDDVLAKDSLDKVNEIILEHPQHKHFLFLVDDFIGLRPDLPIAYQYRDWLNGSVTGDFVHVLDRKSLIENLFDENFRLYESLNWLRIFKANEITFFYPFVVTERDRKRSDSLSNEYLLQNKKHLEQEYNYTLRYLEYYEQDLIDHNLFYLLGNLLPKSIGIGIGIGETGKNKELLDRLRKINRLKYIVLSLLNFRIFSPIIYLSITTWSKMKHQK